MWCDVMYVFDVCITSTSLQTEFCMFFWRFSIDFVFWTSLLTTHSSIACGSAQILCTSPVAAACGNGVREKTKIRCVNFPLLRPSRKTAAGCMNFLRAQKWQMFRTKWPEKNPCKIRAEFVRNSCQNPCAPKPFFSRALGTQSHFRSVRPFRVGPNDHPLVAEGSVVTCMMRRPAQAEICQTKIHVTAVQGCAHESE